MTTTEPTKLNTLQRILQPGTPITTEELSASGISVDLAVHYVRAGWLKRLARGVYLRPTDDLALYPALLFLEQRIQGLHVGGKTALDWYGIRHYVTQKPALDLYGWDSARLPPWFILSFPAHYRRKHLFSESGDAPLHVGPFEQRPNAPRTSAPERALLEMLDEVGTRQTLTEAAQLVESTYSLRARVLSELLQRCTRVKTVRLCLQLGEQKQAPWLAKLEKQNLPRGSDRPWITRSRDGLLVLKP